MAGTPEAQREWIQRVLGISLLGAGGSAGVADAEAAAREWQAARQEWQDASDTVDGQITGFARALMATDDEDLEEIAEFGLNAMTAGYKVKLMAAMADLRAGDAAALRAGGGKALAAVQEFKAHIDADERVAACDENTLGAPVSIRATLGPALTRMAGVLRSVASP